MQERHAEAQCELADEAGGQTKAHRSASPIGPGCRESQVHTLPQFALDNLEASPRAMLGWCHALEKFGVAVVQTAHRISKLSWSLRVYMDRVCMKVHVDRT